MRYLALATDYDGTLADHGHADDAALSAIERLRMSGRRAVLLTGRQVDDLLAVFPRARLFDYVVAENGAVLYDPRTREQTCLGRPPPEEFLQRLRELTGGSMALGKVVVSTWLPHHIAVLPTSSPRSVSVSNSRPNKLRKPSSKSVLVLCLLPSSIPP